MHPGDLIYFVPSNMVGDREVTLFHSHSLFDKILGRPFTTVTLVQNQNECSDWREKTSGKAANSWWSIKCCDAVRQAEHNQLYKGIK